MGIFIRVAFLFLVKRWRHIEHKRFYVLKAESKSYEQTRINTKSNIFTVSHRPATAALLALETTILGWPGREPSLVFWLSFVVSNCEFVTFPFVLWARCGTWLYRFLIFAPLLTFKKKHLEMSFATWKLFMFTANVLCIWNNSLYVLTWTVQINTTFNIGPYFKPCVFMKHTLL